MKKKIKKNVIIKAGILFFLMAAFLDILLMKGLINIPKISRNHNSAIQSPFLGHRIYNGNVRPLQNRQKPMSDRLSFARPVGIMDLKNRQKPINTQNFGKPQMVKNAMMMSRSAIASQNRTIPRANLTNLASPASFLNQIPDPFRKIIRSAQFTIHVKDLNTTYNQVLGITDAFSGYVFRSDYSESATKEGSKEDSIVIEVPSRNFDNVLDQIQKLGKVSSRNITGEDVTEEYVDLKSRIRHLSSVEEQFTEILSKAHTIPDILTVQQYMDHIQGEIDRAKGRLRYLSHVTSMSKISLDLIQGVIPAQPKPLSFFVKFGDILKHQLERSLVSIEGAFMEAITILSILVIWSIIYLLPLLALGIVGWKLFKKYKTYFV